MNKTLRVSLSVLVSVLAFGASAPLAFAANPTAPNLGEAGRFIILGSQAVTTTSGSSLSNGDIGITSAARSLITGFTDGVAGAFTELTNGLSYGPADANPAPFPYPLHFATLPVGAAWSTTGAMLTQAATDLGAANTFLAHDPNPTAPTHTLVNTQLGGQTLTPGVYYTASSALITTGALRLDAQGDPNAIWIFSIDGTLTVGAPSGGIDFVNGVGRANNVYWRTGSDTIIEAGVTFIGNIFAWTKVTVAAGAHITGRLFALTDRVTLISDTITAPPAISVPAVTSVTASIGLPAGGTSVTIAGSGFTGATAVNFGSTPATSFTVNSGTSITATSPAGTGTVEVTVITPSGTSATGSADQFIYAIPPTLEVYQTTLGSPSGNPQGNVWASGSATPFLAARTAAIDGTLTSRTTYTPAESSIWGTDGAFGSELYMFSVVKNIPAGSLLEITKTVEHKDAETPSWKSDFSYTYDYPMTAYTHITSTVANDYLSMFDCPVGGTTCTFVTGASLAEDYSGPPALGSSGIPPTDISKGIGFQVQQTINAKVITGTPTLTGVTDNPRGYRQGTGHTGGNAPIDLGTLVNTSSVPAPTTVYVDPAYTTVSCGGHECYYDAFPTIQAAINAVAANGTVSVAEGTYNEAINITKPLTLDGAGPNLTTLSSNSMYMVSVEADNVTIKDIAITSPLYNGSADASGIVVSNAGSKSNLHITNVKIHDIGNPARSTTAGTQGINIGPVNGLEIDHSEIYNIIDNNADSAALGITMWGNSPSVTANNINIHDNVIHNITNSALSEGIALTSNSANVTVNNNIVTGPFSTAGIYTSAGMASGSVTITNNTVTGASPYGILLKSPFAQTVTGNTVSGATVGIQVNATATIAPTINSNSISGNTTGLNNLSSNVVDATKNWWGNASGPGTVGPGTGDTVSTNVNFTPWYINAERTILNTDVVGCMDPIATNYNPTATNQTGVTCIYQSSGGQRAIPAVPANVTTPADCAPGDKFSTATGRNCNAATPATPSTNSNGNANGRVLGAAVFNFTRDLGVGLSGADVTELQKVLISAGLLNIGAPTGNFGQLTKAAVQAFQKEKGIANTGFVGPLTRGELNRNAVATSGSNLSSGQASAITGFLQAFGADADIITNVRAALGL